MGDQIPTNPIYKLTAPFQTCFHGRETQKSEKPTNLNPQACMVLSSMLLEGRMGFHKKHYTAHYIWSSEVWKELPDSSSRQYSNKSKSCEKAQCCSLPAASTKLTFKKKSVLDKKHTIFLETKLNSLFKMGRKKRTIPELFTGRVETRRPAFTWARENRKLLCCWHAE